MNKKYPKKLKVGLVFDDSLDRNDGVAQHVKTVGAWLSDQGHDVVYLVGETRLAHWHGGRIYSLARNIRVSFNANLLSIPAPARRNKVRSVIARENFDVLHVMMPYSPLMAQKVVSGAAPTTVVVGTFHIYPAGKLVIYGSRLLRLMYMRSLARFSRVISVSPAAAEFAKLAFNLKSLVIPNPVNLQQFQISNEIHKNKPKQIVFLGRLVKRKGCRQLIEAFSVIADDDPDVELIIAGDGPDRNSLERLVSRLGLDQQVKFIGYIDELDKPTLLARADIACFPSLYGESFGIVLIEAMAAGARVVVGGDNAGYRSVLGAKPVLLIQPGNKIDFANRLQHLLNDSVLCTELNRWQKQQVQQYDINAVGPQIENVYRDAIARLNKKIDNNANERQ